MVKGLILYYLNIKSTHGYEIQRFTQISGIDQWAKIQSGSIYYALSKLEKSKDIEIVSEESVGQRSRKIYAITKKGRETLHKEMLSQLATPIANVGAAKFIVDPMLATLSENEIQDVIKKHVKELKESLKYWREWKEIKADPNKNRLTAISFELTIQSIQNQIQWHEELLSGLKEYKAESKSFEQFISSFNVERFEQNKEIVHDVNNIEFVQQLKEQIKNDPELAFKDLERILEKMKQEK